MKEVWKPLFGYEGLYEASSHGNIRAPLKTHTDTRGRTMTRKPRMLTVKSSNAKGKHGERYTTLTKNGKSKYIPVTRLIASTFLGPQDKSMRVCHLDGVKYHDEVVNLKWMTISELQSYHHKIGARVNTDEMKKVNSLKHRGHHKQDGEKNSNAKLTPAQVLEIRSMGDAGMLYSAIADFYPVTNDMIGRIVRRKAWRHLPG